MGVSFSFSLIVADKMRARLVSFRCLDRYQFNCLSRLSRKCKTCYIRAFSILPFPVVRRPATFGLRVLYKSPSHTRVSSVRYYNVLQRGSQRKCRVTYGPTRSDDESSSHCCCCVVTLLTLTA